MLRATWSVWCLLVECDRSPVVIVVLNSSSVFWLRRETHWLHRMNIWRLYLSFLIKNSRNWRNKILFWIANEQRGLILQPLFLRWCFVAWVMTLHSLLELSITQFWFLRRTDDEGLRILVNCFHSGMIIILEFKCNFSMWRGYLL